MIIDVALQLLEERAGTERLLPDPAGASR
jgi:hypothetical protein